ncbi:MAG: hypothetical protein HC840_14265 [Leptolyngbyaceae cyanobacterium RM2_2_4]|nr:hypothetical protein [Leptolyngbyaceae cyanobacterium RM2_2_4]
MVSIQKFVQNSGAAFVCLGLSSLAWLGWTGPLPAIAQLSPPVDANTLQNPASQRLLQMFSTDIQATVAACAERGKVNLAAGAGSDGAVICGDGSTQSDISYASYLDTLSNILAASGLVGFRTVVEADPRVTPEMLVTVFSSPEGTATFYNAIQSVIVQSQLLPANAEDSTALLTNEVVGKLRDNLRSPADLEGLLGTTEQYVQVVDNFCTAPGMSVDQAQQETPGLTPIQLYAICVQESGMADEILQLVN